MKNEATNYYYELIDKERNIYELAQLSHQKRKKVVEYSDLLCDPITKKDLEFKQDKLIGNSEYPIKNDIPYFVKDENSSKEWKKLNKQFLNYHKSLSVYSAINSLPLNNYISLITEIGLAKNKRVLDIGAGTGHAFCTFFQYPETIDYYLMDPNLRLIHDQFLRFYPKLSFLKLSHVIAHAEYIPFKKDIFDIVVCLSAVDHFNDVPMFIDEAFRVLKPGGQFLLTSHLDLPEADTDKTNTKDKLFSHSFLERLSRFLYFKKHAVGKDDHTLHVTNTDFFKELLLKSGFKIEVNVTIKRHFYIVATK